jgi:NSS family neurotransmitter:Na+ symporter
VAFLEDEFNIGRKKAGKIFMVVTFLLCQPVIFFLKNGVVDELDFWGGTFFLVIFATIETILFAWVFGMERAWEEVHHGAALAVPRVYKFIIKYITPLFLFIILGAWLYQEWIPIIFMQKVSAENMPYVLATRIGLALMFTVLAVLVKIAWDKKRKGGKK